MTIKSQKTCMYIISKNVYLKRPNQNQISNIAQTLWPHFLMKTQHNLPISMGHILMYATNDLNYAPLTSGANHASHRYIFALDWKHFLLNIHKTFYRVPLRPAGYGRHSFAYLFRLGGLPPIASKTRRVVP